MSLLEVEVPVFWVYHILDSSCKKNCARISVHSQIDHLILKVSFILTSWGIDWDTKLSQCQVTCNKFHQFTYSCNHFTSELFQWKAMLPFLPLHLCLLHSSSLHVPCTSLYCIFSIFSSFFGLSIFKTSILVKKSINNAKQGIFQTNVLFFVLQLNLQIRGLFWWYLQMKRVCLVFSANNFLLTPPFDLHEKFFACLVYTQHHAYRTMY